MNLRSSHGTCYPVAFHSDGRWWRSCFCGSELTLLSWLGPLDAHSITSADSIFKKSCQSWTFSWHTQTTMCSVAPLCLAGSVGITSRPPSVQPCPKPAEPFDHPSRVSSLLCSELACASLPPELTDHEALLSNTLPTCPAPAALALEQCLAYSRCSFNMRT